jgi:4-hydroxybenzoate polyprenyltransferase
MYMVEPTEARDIGIYCTALAAFMAAYGTQGLTTASFFLAAAGFLGFGYDLVSARDVEG